MSHRRKPWAHYDTVPLVYVDVRFDYPTIYRSDPSRTWEVKKREPARHRRRIGAIQ